MPLLDVRDLSVRLGRREVLRQVGFTVGPSEWVGLAGPNGSGKTTLLRTIAGMLPHAGTVSIDGRAVGAWPPRQLAQRLAFVRQVQPMAFDFTVLDFVLLGRAPYRGWLEPFGSTDTDAAFKALARLGLAGFEHRPITQLSGGEQQRARLAQALVQDPDILLLDEPTAHLDVHHQFELMEHVRLLVDDGCTVLSAFHDLTFAARFTDRLLVLHDGELVADGPPRDVLTSDLLRRVFRMEAAIKTEPEITIRYLTPT